MYLGIDFGTTYSTLSIYVDNQKYTGLLSALCGDRGIPTLIRFDPNLVREKGEKPGGWRYGEDTDIEHYPQDTIKDIKKQIRDGGDINEMITTGGRSTSFNELLQTYLAWFIDKRVHTAREDNPDYLAKEEVDRIVVTVPCGFIGEGMTRSLYNQTIRESVIVAAYQTGVHSANIGHPPITIIEEPVAAAIAYFKDPNTGGRSAFGVKKELNILVADLGGGTFDVTFVKGKKDKWVDAVSKEFEVGAKEADLHLGGNDFDEALLQLLISKIRVENPNYALEEDDYRENLRRATLLKEALSENFSGTFNGVLHEKADVTRQEFEEATQHLLQRAMDIIQRCVNKSGGIKKIDKIVLVGGGCRMPQIRNGINNLYPKFGDKNIVLYRPSYSIANGAAYCAAMGNVTVTMIKDVATCTYGKLMFRGVDGSGRPRDPYIANMIFKGTPFIDREIVSPMCTSYPLRKGQTAVVPQVFESTTEEEEIALGEDNVKWNGNGHEVNDERFNSTGLEVEVPIPAEFRGRADEYKLESKMTLTSEGILKLEVFHDGILLASNDINKNETKTE